MIKWFWSILMSLYILGFTVCIWTDRGLTTIWQAIFFQFLVMTMFGLIGALPWIADAD